MPEGNTLLHSDSHIYQRAVYYACLPTTVQLFGAICCPGHRPKYYDMVIRSVGIPIRVPTRKEDVPCSFLIESTC